MKFHTKSFASPLFAFGVLAIAASPSMAQRVNTGMVVGYDFREGSGTTVGDHSGNGTPLNLTIHEPGNVTWGAGFLTFSNATIVSSASAANVASESSASKIFNAITATEEITIEAWLVPANTVENAGPARVATMSVNSSNRNFTLGQDMTNWQARLRTTDTGVNGANPFSVTTTNPVDLSLQHIVYTRAANGDANLFVNGVEDPGAAANVPITGFLTNWNATYDFGLGNELTWTNASDRDFLGDMHLVAVYDRALSADQVQLNFLAGAAAAVPEPSSMLFCALGLVAVCGRRYRRKRATLRSGD